MERNLIMENNKSYFGITIHKHGIKLDDIVMIPYDSYWDKASIEIDGIKYLDIITWKNYATQYIEQHNLIFADGLFTSTYTFGDTRNGEVVTDISNITINPAEPLEETRHILLSDDEAVTK